jgi:hypothetical protein
VSRGVKEVQRDRVLAEHVIIVHTDTTMYQNSVTIYPYGLMIRPYTIYHTTYQVSAFASACCACHSAISCGEGSRVFSSSSSSVEGSLQDEKKLIFVCVCVFVFRFWYCVLGS